MQLEPTEAQLIEKCRKEERSWKGWASAFTTMGYFLIGFWVLARRMPALGESAVIVLAAAYYFIETGINERREHSLRRLVLKFAEEK